MGPAQDARSGYLFTGVVCTHPFGDGTKKTFEQRGRCGRAFAKIEVAVVNGGTARPVAPARA